MMERPPALVILAAGASRRLGTCKALVDLGGRSALARLLEAAAGLAGEPPLVVTGPDHGPIAAATPPAAELAHNAGWGRGRGTSIALAVARRPGRDLCLAPVDVPLVGAGVFEAMVRAWRQAGAPAGGWLAPWVGVAGGRRHGHPVVVGRALAARATDAWARDGHSLRDLRAAAEPLLGVEVGDPAVLDDLDTPQDLGHLRRRLGLA